MTTAAPQLFEWKEEYSVGIPIMDTQHKILIRLINDLHTAMLLGRGRDVMSRILNELVHYTETHFASEEGMMQRRGYPDLAAHKEEHHRLTGQVYELRERYASGKMVLTAEVMHFLKDWLAKHILQSDQKYAHVLDAR